MASSPETRARKARYLRVGRFHRIPGPVAAIALLACAVYINAIDNRFVYDDYFTVVNNPSIVDPRNVRFLFAYTPFRPVVNASYAIDLFIWGYRPIGFHLTNVFLHAAISVMLYLLLRRMFEDLRVRAGRPNADTGLADMWGAFVPTALFAVHPLMTEAVAYISGRSELLCAVFFLGTLLSARVAMAGEALRGSTSGPARKPRVRLATACAAVCGGLAFLSKEVAAALPFVLIAYDGLILPGTAEARRRRLRRVFIPLLILLAAAAVFRVRALVGRDATLSQSPVLSVMTQCIVLWRYMALVVVPKGQAIMHGFHTVRSVLDPLGLAAAAGLAAVAFGAYALRRRQPLVTFGLIWFFAAIAPSSSVITLREGMAEHRVYVASAGILIAACAFTLKAGGRLARARTGLDHTYALLFAAGITVFLSLTLIRNSVWASPVHLWLEAKQAAPGMWEPMYALGDALRESGDCVSALVEYEAVLRLVPTHREAMTNMGICLAETDRFDDAEAAFKRVLALDPSFARGYTNLGSLALRRGDPLRARDYYRQAIATDAKTVTARMQLARLYETTFRDYKAALQLCQEVRGMAPMATGVLECIERNRNLVEEREGERRP